MDVQSAFRIRIAVGGEIVIVGMVDMQGSQVRGGVSTNRDDLVRSHFMGALSKEQVACQYCKANQGDNSSHVTIDRRRENLKCPTLEVEGTAEASGRSLSYHETRRMDIKHG